MNRGTCEVLVCLLYSASEQVMIYADTGNCGEWARIAFVAAL